MLLFFVSLVIPIPNIRQIIGSNTLAAIYYLDFDIPPRNALPDGYVLIRAAVVDGVD